VGSVTPQSYFADDFPGERMIAGRPVARLGTSASPAGDRNVRTRVAVRGGNYSRPRRKVIRLA